MDSLVESFVMLRDCQFQSKKKSSIDFEIPIINIFQHPHINYFHYISKAIGQMSTCDAIAYWYSFPSYWPRFWFVHKYVQETKFVQQHIFKQIKMRVNAMYLSMHKLMIHTEKVARKNANKLKQ